MATVQDSIYRIMKKGDWVSIDDLVREIGGRRQNITRGLYKLRIKQKMEVKMTGTNPRVLFKLKDSKTG